MASDTCLITITTTSWHIVDVRNDAAVDVHVDSRVSRALPYVLLVVVVNRHVLLPCISNLKDVNVLYILYVF